ncbi:MMPL family transporter [Flavobacteriales bacterium]|nr:MMPL family transporter [Flavobacteriales bacterium]
MRNPRILSALILTAVGLFTLVCIVAIQNLEFDYNFEKFYPEEDAETRFFKEHREMFSSDNDFLLLAVKNDAGVFQKEFLLKVEDLLAEIDTVSNLDTVLSLTRMNKLFVSDFGKWKVPYINYEELDNLKDDSIWIAKTPDVYGHLISKDFKSFSIFLKHKDYLSAAGCDQLAQSLKAIKARYAFDEIHIAGRAVGQNYYVNLMQSELMFFSLTSFFLLVVFLILAFRSWWGVLLPVVVVVLSVIWILGVMSILNKPINLVLTVMPTIIFVVGMSDVIHISSKYLEELRRGRGKMTALRLTVKEVGVATLLTSVTTAIGFLTLYSSRVVPIKDFGLYVSVGVMIAFVLSFLVLPAMFILIPVPKLAKKRLEHSFWTFYLRKSFLWTIRNQLKIGIISAIILIFSAIGLTSVEVNNFLLEDLKKDDPMNLSFQFFDENFSGVRPMELAVESKSVDILTVEGLRALDSLEQIIVRTYPVDLLISPLTAIKMINRIQMGGLNQHYGLPVSDIDLQKAINRFKRLMSSTIGSKYLSADGKVARMSATAPDLGGDAFNAINAAFKSEIEGLFPKFKITHTGTAHLIDKNNQYLASSMIWSLGIAFSVIALIVGFLYKSVRMVLIALIPNVFPLIMIGGVMGFLGIDIKVSTSILFTIAFGIAVDDTIHFISKLKLELKKGNQMIFAIRRTYMSTGRALVLTTAILCAGFLTLIASDFLGTFYMGFLITLALIFAVLSDLFLLPVLILAFYRDKKQRLAE